MRLSLVVIAATTEAMSEITNQPLSATCRLRRRLRDGDLGGLVQAGELLDAAAGEVGEVGLGEELRGPEADDVDRHAGDDVVDAERHRGERVQGTADGAEQRRAEDADRTGRSSR